MNLHAIPIIKRGKRHYYASELQISRFRDTYSMSMRIHADIGNNINFVRSCILGRHKQKTMSLIVMAYGNQFAFQCIAYSCVPYHDSDLHVIEFHLLTDSYEQQNDGTAIPRTYSKRFR